jgi:hypothetical protein
MSEVAEKRPPPLYYNIKTMQTRGCCGHTLSCARGVVFGACSIINAPNYIMFSAPVCAKTRQHAARRHCVCVRAGGVGFNHSARQQPDSHSFGAK